MTAERRVRGRRLVVALALFVLATVFVIGVALGIATDATTPALFAVVPLPDGPVGVAAFGVGTVGAGVAGVLAALVAVDRLR